MDSLMLTWYHLGGNQTNISKPCLLHFMDLLNKHILYPFFSLPVPPKFYSFHKTNYANNLLPVILHLSGHGNTPDIRAEHWACHRHRVFFGPCLVQLVTMWPDGVSVQNRVCCISYWRKDSQTSYSTPLHTSPCTLQQSSKPGSVTQSSKTIAINHNELTLLAWKEQQVS